ncbi:uncharacterized protein LOC132727409 [Ruditapes philippinarum]|uniref:uncharacterized protein LOC132727409 n=1 Tax=Ruditapes philippinarum TaxID=129788 RepID=UPI00295B7C73|nr:uncharacterized protein LOC132727409 [Ruditapes philippinarum]
MNSSSSLFRLVFFLGFGCTVRLSDCLTISAAYGPSDVEFTCVINPYTGSQRWYVGSVIVALCGANSCTEEPTNPARYSFTPNRASGIFIFKIDPINSTDDNTIVGCYNGMDTDTQALKFPDQNNSSISKTTNATGTGTNHTTVPSSIASVTILPNTTFFTPVLKTDKKSSYFVLFIALAFVVLILSMVMLFYLFFLTKSRIRTNRKTSFGLNEKTY